MAPALAARRRALPLVAGGLLLAVALSGCASGSEPGVLRLGYFPNLTHAQPLYGVQTKLYEETLGEFRLEAVDFNAGPSAFEALRAGTVDVIYVGPSPTLNAIARSSGTIRIIAGSAMGGAAFVVGNDVRLDSDADLAGKTFATPQLGNTQDVALKHWLLGKGHKPTDKGGDVEIIYAQNADILAMLQRNQIHGAWVPEPWATRLQLEGGGRILVDEATAGLWPGGEFITTQLVTTKMFLDSHPQEVARLLDAHVAATRRLAIVDGDEQTAINDAIEALTGKRLSDQTMETAVAKVVFTTEPLPDAMQTLAQWSRDIGFDAPQADAITQAYDLAPLRAALDRAGPP